MPGMILTVPDSGLVAAYTAEISIAKPYVLVNQGLKLRQPFSLCLDALLVGLMACCFAFLGYGPALISRILYGAFFIVEVTSR